MSKRLHLSIRGRVQGVCYRAYTRDKARSLGLTGWVCNRVDGTVELLAEGESDALRGLRDWCWQGSPWAHVDGIDDRWDEATGEFAEFVVASTH